MSFTGHAGVVSSIENATRPPSMRKFLMNPSETMSRCRSGSLTTASAARTACSVTISSISLARFSEGQGSSPVWTSAEDYTHFDVRGGSGRRGNRERKSIAVLHARRDDESDRMAAEGLARAVAGFARVRPDFAAATARDAHSPDRDVERHRDTM